jgi:hypothetical protein
MHDANERLLGAADTADPDLRRERGDSVGAVERGGLEGVFEFGVRGDDERVDVVSVV